MTLRRGFTLIELLVVIAIIALLVGILVPALSAAKSRANLVRCMANMKGLVTASALYSDSHRGEMPFANSHTLETTGDKDGTVWTDPGWLYQKSLGMTLPIHVQNGSLFSYLGGAMGVYRCPSDGGPFDTDLVKRPIRNLTSYLINGAVDGYATHLPPYHLEQFASNCILFTEEDENGDYWNDGNTSISLGGGPTVEKPTKRHIGGSNVGCFDTHVERLDDSTWNTETVKMPGRFWCNPGASNGQS